jgi:hypothetical protein
VCRPVGFNPENDKTKNKTKQNEERNNLLTGLLKKRKEKKQDNKLSEPQPGKYSCFQSGGI